MNLMVLATISWDFGESTVSFPVPEFDIHDKEKCIEVAKDVLIQYGVKPDELLHNEEDKYRLSFIANIGEFERPVPREKIFVSEREVEVKYRYIFEHRGRYYGEIKELEGVHIVASSKE